MRKSLRAVAIAGVVSLLAAGALAPTVSAAPTAVDKGLLRAQAIVKKFAPNPKTVGITVPLTKRPPTGLTVVSLASSNEQSTIINSYIAEAAAIMGWNWKQIIYSQSTPEKQRAAFQQALDLRPDAITTAGVEASVFGSDLVDKAAAQGTYVICQACVEAPPNDNWNTVVNPPAGLVAGGTAVAAAVVAASKGTANIQMISFPAVPVLKVFGDSFIAGIRAMCSKCQIAENNFSPGDIGTKVPGATVSIVQKNPATTWLVATVGSGLVGVPSALASAGLGGGKFQLASGVAGRNNLVDLNSGVQAAAFAIPNSLSGFRQIDAIARHELGMSQQKSITPFQLLTNVNIKGAVISANGDYMGLPNYAQQFKKLWRIP